MSTHLLIAAAYLEDLPQATKLVLMAVADSADEHTLEAAPGLPKLRAWSGLSRSQALRVVAKLEADKLIEQTVRGNRGRRAVWRVFPAGVPAIPHPTEVAARYAEAVVPNGDNADEPVDNPTGKGRTGATQSAGKGSHIGPIGSHGCDPFSPLLQSSRASAPQPQPAGRVDKPTSSASTGTGFPGARRPVVEEDRGASKRAPGGHNLPCPTGDHGSRHGEIAGACGRCAHAAATSDPTRIAAARKRARDALKTPAPAAATTTATEEKRTA